MKCAGRTTLRSISVSDEGRCRRTRTSGHFEGGGSPEETEASGLTGAWRALSLRVPMARNELRTLEELVIGHDLDISRVAAEEQDDFRVGRSLRDLLSFLINEGIALEFQQAASLLFENL